MPSRTKVDTTELLARAHAGDRDAFDLLYSQMYEALLDIARRQRRKGRARETLDTTSLVHEAYHRLVNETGVSWECRAHFLAIAARTMRRVIVDYARKREALKRGGGKPHVTLRPDCIKVERQIEELVAIDEALETLATIDERLERVAECRLFGNLTHEETAQALAISPRTAQRDWQRARAWLQRELST